MKRKHLTAFAMAMIMAVSAVGTAGCDKDPTEETKAKKAEVEVEETTEETTEETVAESEEMTEETTEESTEATTTAQAEDLSLEPMPLIENDASFKEADLDGLWSDENGSVLEIDTESGYLRLLDGDILVIDEITDDGIYVHQRSSYDYKEMPGGAVYRNIYRSSIQSMTVSSKYLDSCSTFRFPLYLSDGKMFYFDHEITPDDKKRDITSELCDGVFSMIGSEFEFKDDGSVKIKVRGSDVEGGYLVNGLKVTIRLEEEEINLFGYFEGGALRLTTPDGGCWQKESVFPQGIRLDTISESLWLIGPDGKATVQGEDGKVEETVDMSGFDPNPDPGTFIDEEGGALLMNVSRGLTYYMKGETAAALVEEGSWPFEIYRLMTSVKDGTRANDLHTDGVHRVKTDIDEFTVEPDIGDADIKDVWLEDYCSVNVNRGTDNLSVDCDPYDKALTGDVVIGKGGLFKGAKVKISSSLSADIDNVRIRNLRTGKIVESAKITSENGVITAEFDIPETNDMYMSYCMVDVSVAEEQNVVFDHDALLKTDPAESMWAKTCKTGDILKLVDMDYLKNSGYAEDGSAEFWVSTPEEFASATYYINALDAKTEPGEQPSFRIRMVKDIDLTGYEWVPLGRRDVKTVDGVEYDHTFQGIIYGNGCTIKGLTISPDNGHSMFEALYMSTIIGLTLDDPHIDGDILFDHNSIMSDVIDCHIKVYGDYGDCEFASGDNESNTFIDCTFEVDGKDKKLDGYVTEFDENHGNWVMQDYQDSNGSYKYDPEGEYEEYLRIIGG